MADSIVRLKVEDGSFNAKIKEAARSFADFGKRVASAGADAMADFAKGVKTAKVAFQGFNAALKANALVLVASLAVQAASAIGEMIGDWISGADDAAEAQKRLNDQLEETKRLVNQINDEGDFNARIAKAMGKSTADILQMKVDSARQAYNVALANVLDPALKAGTEEYDKAKKVEEQAQKRLQKALQDQQVDAIARQYKTGEYAAKGGGGGRQAVAKELTELQSNQQRINDLTQEYVNISDDSTDSVKNRQTEIQKEISLLQSRNNVLKLYAEQAQGKLLGGDVNKTDLSGSKFRGFAAASLDVGKGLTPEAIESANKLVSAGNETAVAWSNAASAISSVGSAMAGIQDPSIRVAGLVAQAIGTIALAYAKALETDWTSKTSIYTFIAAAAASTASMIGTISAIHSASGYAEGGIVKGNSYSGDNVGPVMLDAGELILNRSQQATLANSLTGQTGNLRVTGILQGTSLVMCVENTLRSQGKGELATWKS